MKEDRPKVWMVARQLSFKHVLRASCEANSSFSMHTEYFVVFWRKAMFAPAQFTHAFEGEKVFLFKGKDTAGNRWMKRKRGRIASVDTASRRYLFWGQGTALKFLAL